MRKSLTPVRVRRSPGNPCNRGAELLATEGLGHRKILKDAEVLGKVALFTL